MENIGEQLSKSRQAHGFSIAEVAARLRIRTKFVEALENEQWNVVGEFVYVRGFLKNYADLLGLDPNPLLLALRSSYQPESGVHVTSPVAPQPYPAASRSLASQNNTWFPWVMAALTTIAGVLVVLVAISVASLLAPSNRTAGAHPDTAQQPSLGATPASAISKPDDSNAAFSSNTNSELNASGVNLRLQLTQRSWLSVIVDGKRVVYETLPAGTVREFHGIREITLRAGNAGGVVANIDGKNLGALGQAGQVEDRVFAVKTPVDQVNGVHE